MLTLCQAWLTWDGLEEDEAGVPDQGHAGPHQGHYVDHRPNRVDVRLVLSHHQLGEGGEAERKINIRGNKEYIEKKK